MVLPRALSFARSLRSHRLLAANGRVPRPPCRSRRPNKSHLGPPRTRGGETALSPERTSD